MMDRTVRELLDMSAEMLECAEGLGDAPDEFRNGHINAAKILFERACVLTARSVGREAQFEMAVPEPKTAPKPVRL